MFDFKTLIETLWPDSQLGDIDPNGDLAKLFEGLASHYQDLYDVLFNLAYIRDPRLTNVLPDLEREFGIVTDTSLSEAVRRQMLAHVVYQRSTTASWEHLQNALIDAGFTNLIVTPNQPVVDPADVSSGAGEVLVNGTLYTNQSPAYYMAAGSSIAYAAHSRGFAGYYLSNNKTEKTYSIPSEIKAHWTWRYIFWVGGAASGWPSSPIVAQANIDSQRETQLKNLILKYKPSYTWCVLRINWT